MSESNPFAAFSYYSSPTQEGETKPTVETREGDSGGGILMLGKKRALQLVSSTETTRTKKNGSCVGTKKKECGPAEDFNSMSPFEQRLVFLKWHRVCAEARKRTRPDNVDAYRFQVLGAVLLSAQAQESMVRTAVETLATKLQGGYTAEALASVADDTQVASLITFIHYNKAKAKNLVKAAKMVHTRLHGRVPTTRHGLLAIPGIGPMLAPLLVFLFRYQKEHEEEFPFTLGGSGEGGGLEQEGEGAAVVQQDTTSDV